MKQRKDGRYKATMTYNGQRVPFYGRTRKEAQAKLNEARLKMQKGHELGAPKQTAGTFMDGWLGTIKRKVRPSTWDSYKLNVERARPYIGHVRLDALRPAHIDAAYTALLQRGLSARSVEQCHRVLRAALRHAVNTDLIPKAPTAAASPPRAQRREMQALDSEQVPTRFASSQSHRLHALWVLLTTTGLRIGEAAALTWDDLALDAGRLSIRHTVSRQKGVGLTVGPAKTDGSRRTVHLGAVAIEALRLHRDRQTMERRKAAELWTEHGRVFSNETGG